MTNTKFRKRALLSSVAMLLVALVALGSATFAWFTDNPNAKATGLTLKATASKGLVIRTSTANSAGFTSFVHDDYLNCDTTQRRASTTAIDLPAISLDTDTATSAGTFTAYTTAAAADNDEAAAPEAAVTQVNTGIYNEQIACKLTGSDTSAAIKFQSTGITITGNASNQDILSAVRIALFWHDASANSGAGSTTFLGEYAPSAVNSEKHLTGTIVADTAPATSGNSKGYDDVATATYSVKAISTTAGADIGTVHTNGSDYLDVYVYLDGEDANCFTNNVSLDAIVDSITIPMTVAS